jgi:hypothetical protein
MEREVDRRREPGLDGFDRSPQPHPPAGGRTQSRQLFRSVNIDKAVRGERQDEQIVNHDTQKPQKEIDVLR